MQTRVRLTGTIISDDFLHETALSSPGREDPSCE